VNRLVVHVGPPKTATTYIQRALFANEALLREHGVYLPHTGRLELEPHAICHHHLGWELMESPRYRPDIGGWEVLAAELADNDAPVVLVSSEVLDRATLTPDHQAVLRDRLVALDREVTVVYVVREPLSLINSDYVQRVKMLRETEPFPAHVGGVLRRREVDLVRRTAHWYESGDVEFVAVPYPVLTESDPLAALLGAARIDVPLDTLVTDSGPVNIALGPVAVEAFRLLRTYLAGLNRSISDDDVAVRRLHRIAARAAQDAGWCEDVFWGWPPGLAARAAQELAASNEQFADAVWGTPWPLDLPVDRPQARAHLLQLPPDELDRVHAFVIAMAKRYVTLRSGR
jgi:hypothetical protein